MSDTAQPAVQDAIDWSRARRFLREALLHMLHHRDPHLADDLAQEAMVRLLRLSRSGEPIRNLEALMNTLARRTLTDHLRRAGVRRAILVESGEDAPEIPDFRSRPDLPPDPLAMIEFLVIEHFTATSSPCLALARHFFESLDWSQVATAVGKAPTAVRKQWSRCVETLREAARREGSALWILGQDLVGA